ncbi:MAG: hypothetical protein AB1772_07925 [Candidatus Zixiibacteriota bacterium]
MRLNPIHIRGLRVLAVAAGLMLPSHSILAQGSIFGEVHRSDLSVPPDGGIMFLGFINNVDREIRVQSCIGAGYDGGHWYDDFQNFVGEAPGMAYHYYFFDLERSERFLLNKTIPTNSFQREDVTLATASFPRPPAALRARRIDPITVRLDWVTEAGTTWHVYRRDGNSNGSFFRIDNPAGDRTDRGETSPSYLDRTVDTMKSYAYIVVAETGAGNYSPASDPAFISLTPCCLGLVGDINGTGGDEPSIGDISLLLDHLFISITPPQCLREADVNQSGGLYPTFQDISIIDVTILIDHLFIDFVPLRRCEDAGQ